MQISPDAEKEVSRCKTQIQQVQRCHKEWHLENPKVYEEKRKEEIHEPELFTQARKLSLPHIIKYTWKFQATESGFTVSDEILISILQFQAVFYVLNLVLISKILNFYNISVIKFIIFIFINDQNTEQNSKMNIKQIFIKKVL